MSIKGAIMLSDDFEYEVVRHIEGAKILLDSLSALMEESSYEYARPGIDTLYQMLGDLHQKSKIYSSKMSDIELKAKKAEEIA